MHDELIRNLRDLVTAVMPEWESKAAEAMSQAAAALEAMQADARRLNHLEKLALRVAFQNNKRPTESVGSDLHMRDGRCSLYVRDLFGNAVEAECGYGGSVREAIDDAMNQPAGITKGSTR